MRKSNLDGKVKSRYIVLPPTATKAEREDLVATMEGRAENPEEFVTGLDVVYDRTPEEGIAVYDALTAKLHVNGLHPFVGAFFDEFVGKTSGLPLEVFAMAEVLLESQLHQIGLRQQQIDVMMDARDQLLRSVAQESGRMTPLTVANALRNAKNDENGLEIWVVEAFRSLGFESTRIGKAGKPDGVAEANLSPGSDKQPRRYRVSLEAKSKKKDNATVSAKTVGIAAVARQRKDFNCDHAVVVGPAFPTTKDEKSALSKEIQGDRELTAQAGEPKTITLITVDDLANLVQHRPVKDITLQRLRELFTTCSLPAESKKWIEDVIAEKPVRHNYQVIVNTISKLQSKQRREPVSYGELRNELEHAKPKIEYPDLDDLVDVCKRMAGLAPKEVDANDLSVELNQSVENVMQKLNAATKAHLKDSSSGGA